MGGPPRIKAKAKRWGFHKHMNMKLAAASALLLLLLGLAWTQGSHSWVGTAACAGAGRPRRGEEGA